MHSGFQWGKLEGKSLGRPRHSWEDDIKMGLKENGVRRHRMELFCLWAVVNLVLNLWVP